MDKSEIYKMLTPVFQEVFDDDNLVPKAEMSAKDVVGWDSVNHIRLIVSIEAAFGLRFSVTEVAELSNVGEFVELIARRK